MINVRNAFLSAAMLIGASCPVMADQMPTIFHPFARYDDAKGLWVDEGGTPLPTAQAKQDAPAPDEQIIRQRQIDLAIAKQASVAAMQLAILIDIKKILCGMSPSCQGEGQK